MEQIKQRGLLPVDFLKHGHDNPDAVGALYDNDPTLVRMSVSDPQHICNVLSDEELQMLVSQPEGCSCQSLLSPEKQKRETLSFLSSV